MKQSCRLMKTASPIHRIVSQVPPNCTDQLQLIDLSVNKSAKEFLHAKFRVRYSEQVQQKLAKSDSSIVDTRMSVMKPIGASWLKSLSNENQMIAKNGFKAAGIIDVLRAHTLSLS